MSFIGNIFGLKSVPAIDSVNEVTREGLPKAFIPYFFYKPPFRLSKIHGFSYN